jgi:hypothetical protein
MHFCGVQGRRYDVLSASARFDWTLCRTMPKRQAQRCPHVQFAKYYVQCQLALYIVSNCHDIGRIDVYHGVTRKPNVGSRILQVSSGSWQRRMTSSKVKTLVDGELSHRMSHGLRPLALHGRQGRCAIANSPAQTFDPGGIHFWLSHSHYAGCLAFRGHAEFLCRSMVTLADPSFRTPK